MNSRNDQVASILSWTSTVLYGSFLNPQLCCAQLQAWSKYADIFNSQALVCSCQQGALFLFEWSWSCECEVKSFKTFGLIISNNYLSH